MIDFKVYIIIIKKKKKKEVVNNEADLHTFSICETVLLNSLTQILDDILIYMTSDLGTS